MTEEKEEKTGKWMAEQKYYHRLNALTYLADLLTKVEYAKIYSKIATEFARDFTKGE